MLEARCPGVPTPGDTKVSSPGLALARLTSSATERAGALAEAEFHHPDISFGWGVASLSLRTKKIKGLHENDFIMAAKIDRLAGAAGGGV